VLRGGYFEFIQCYLLRHGRMVLMGLKPISVANWLPSVLDAVGWVIWSVKFVYEMTYR